MPVFGYDAVSLAPVEEVWKLLYDPTRFPDWWAGFETVLPPESEGSGRSRFTYYPTGYPDYPMPQLLDTYREQGRVVVSCLVSELRFEWRLECVADDATRIRVQVEIPETEAWRLESQRAVISTSVRRLADLAADGLR